MSINIGKQAVSVIVIGGATKGGSGFGITPDGRIVKIPDNNPLHHIAALGEIAASTKSSALKSKLQSVIAGELRGSR